MGVGGRCLPHTALFKFGEGGNLRGSVCVCVSSESTNLQSSDPELILKMKIDRQHPGGGV